MKFKEEDLKRMYWHSRRGMLELDLLLVPFASEQLRFLDEPDLALYQELLLEEDQDLYMWLTRREEAPTENLRKIITLVLSKNLAPWKHAQPPASA